MFTVNVPPPPPAMKLTLVQWNGQTVLVELPCVNGKTRAKRGALLALFTPPANPSFCVRGGNF